MRVLFLFLFVLSFLPNVSWAAPCCARNSATPALIVGDDWAQFNFGTTLSLVASEPTGLPSSFRNPGVQDLIQNYRMDGSMLLSDRLQAGISLSVVNHSITGETVSDSTFAPGDTRLNLGYEALPTWSYSKWKPQILLFSVITLPTGSSKYESQKATLSDVTGNGFYSFSLGSLIVKRWNQFDAFLIPEAHYSLNRSVQNSYTAFQVAPGFGGSLGVGVGMSPWGGNLRIGLRVQQRIDQATLTLGSFASSSTGGLLAACDTGLDMGLLIGSTQTLMMSYTDQTLLGYATSLNLNRSIALNFQHRLER